MSSTANLPQLHYQVALPEPANHYFEVALTVTSWSAPVLDLKMPVWTPGSYLIREYERHVQELKATDLSTQNLLTVTKQRKNHWQINTESCEQVQVTYRVYAYDLSVRTNHLDTSHGYFNGAALFYWIPGYERLPLTLEIVPPQADWQVSTALAPLPGKPNCFQVLNFDTLVDSPVEVGTHQIHRFEVLGKSHTFAIWGDGNLNVAQLLADTQKIIEVEAQLFGGLPYDHYLFILHLSSQGYGGLEHQNSCTLNYSRFGFRDPEKYQRFLQLVAHEFFHLWNVKRLRPKALESFDYGQENYTESLWFSEGTTSYYDLLIPLRAGIYDGKTFLKNLSQEITRYLLTPGRLVQPLAESSFDAWIKLYRRDANSDNSQISYYLKGELVTLLLDLLIRERHQNQRSFDQVLQGLWEKFGKDEIGFTPDQLKAEIEAVTGLDLQDFFQRYLHSTEELPFDAYLEPFGLTLKPILEESSPYLGLKVQSENGVNKIKFVARNSPAEKAGISPDDELLALNGLRVSADQLADRLKDYPVEGQIELTIFHQDQLQTVTVRLAPPQPSRYELIPLERPSERQRQNLQGWLGFGI
ncbi:M61 family metallopeptidase [Synechocystis sp. LKSZ1]|uniref:M61 family metallopeptidase n=1 Tax=Synechocystis sp. LKSZ1 TaxID=3144951 RepID=UPI00336C2C29